MKNIAHFNTHTKKGTYSHSIHHGEVVPDAKVINDAPSAYGQNLAAPKGSEGAKRSLRDRKS